MADLPVRQMTLYKHGVGFFVRQGEVSGESVALTFRQDEMDDVLKSLAVIDRGGGQVLNIQYATPMDVDARLAQSSIRLSDHASLRDLIRDLRGRRVTLYILETGGSTEALSGRMVGLDEQATEESAVIHVALLDDAGQTHRVNFYGLESLQIHDEQSAHDLTYFLDTSMSEDTRRTVTVRLSEGDHDLAVYYVAPSPTWRVSYRLVAESDQDDKTGATGKALLQGWGLFDNRLDEDLENVAVTLVAGQPISFIYALYDSRIPVRPRVADESRVAPGPIEFASAEPDWLADDEPEERARGITMSAPAPLRKAQAAGFGAANDRILGIESARQQAQPAAEGKETGETFQYVVTTPVSVKRGESALVPIIGADIQYNRELLYNGAKFPTHPVAAMRFKNSTGLTFERGPVTVVEDGDYRGEAVVAFTKDGGEVYLPYAVELGVRITESTQHRTEFNRLSIDKGYMVYEEYQVFTTAYIIENTTAKAHPITVEKPVTHGRELVNTPAPDVETANERRWRVEVLAKGKNILRVIERARSSRREDVTRLDYTRLQKFLADKWIDQELHDRLAPLVEKLAFIQSARAELDALDSETKALYTRQEQMRANLGALKADGDEAALRRRVLSQLEAAQTRLEAIDTRVETLKREIAEAEAALKEIVAGLG